MTEQAWAPTPIYFTKWLRGFPDMPKFGSAADPENMCTFRILGDRYSGKSALLEAIESQYFANGSTIYDVFGANDNEMLAWLDSPFRDRVVLIHGDDMQVKSNFETITMGKLNPRNVPDQKIFLTSRVFFRKRADDFHFYSALYSLTKKFRDRDSFNRVDVIGIREADEFMSSAKAAGQGKVKAQNDAEIEFAKFHNQMVHYGYALVIDQHRDVDVVKKVRYLSTYLFFKNMGDIDMPRPWWPLRYLDPDRLLRRLSKRQFAVKTTRQCIGVGVNDCPPWHIKRGSGLFEKFGIEVIDTFTGETVATGETPPQEHGKGIAIDEVTKLKIIDMASKGRKQTEIAKELGISQPMISKFLAKRREEGEKAAP